MYIPLDDDKENAAVITFEDDSRIFIYAAPKSQQLTALEVENTKRMNDPKFDEYTKPNGYGAIKAPIYYSSLNGLMAYGNDLISWGKESFTELKESPLSIGKVALGGYIHYAYWYIMSIFKYANSEGRVSAMIVRRNNENSLAEKAKIIDYIKYVKIQTSAQEHVTIRSIAL